MKHTLSLVSVLLSAIFVISCGKDDSSAPKPEAEKKGTCTLKSFRLSSSSNKLKEDVIFHRTNNDYNGTCLEWISGTDPENLIPTFTHNGEKVLLDGQEIESGKTRINFSKDFKLTVVAENGKTSVYKISLICPQINQELPVLHFYIDVNTITSKTSYRETALEMYSPSTAKGSWSHYGDKVQIRGRGNSTWTMPKKPYRFKFPEKFSPIGLDHCEARSWVILAHDMDKSLIRNHLAFEASKVMFNPKDNWHEKEAVLFTPCSRMVNVYFNGKYHGIYQMSDQMERHKGRIEVDKLEASDGSDVSKISGGYILETYWTPDPSPIGFESSSGIRFNIKYPDDDNYDPAQLDYIKQFLNEAEAVLYSENFMDKNNGWRKYFDEKTLADYIIVKEFVGDMDGFTSTYCYKVRGVDKLFFGPVWDCDKGWRNDRRIPDPAYNPATSLMIYSGFGMPGCKREDWYKRFWLDPDFRQLVKARWDSKKSELQQVIDRNLKEMPARMPKSIEANYTVWDFKTQNMGDAPAPAGNYDGEIARIRNYTSSRVQLLDKLFN